MNNNGTIFVGALIGAGIGYLVADWYIETYIPEEGFELIAQPNQIERFEKRLAKAKITKSETTEARNYTEFFQKERRPDLAALAKRYAGAGGDIEVNTIEQEDADLAEAGLLDFNEDDEETEEMIDDGNDPGIISVALYAADEEFTHTTLRYYTDDVLTDEAGVPVNRPEKFLPENALVSFGELSQDPDIVYVRNTEKKCMYEIVRMDTPFASNDSGRIRRSAKPDYVKVKKEMGYNGEKEDN